MPCRVIRAAGFALVLLLLHVPGRAEPANAAISLDEATAMVRERSGGRVVRAERTVEGGHVVYAIRVITTDGRVKTWRVDAESGQVR